MLKTKEILGEEITQMNERHIENLKKRVISDKVTWILGAGISKSIGVPLWRECLLRMWARILLLEKDDNSNTTIGEEFRNTLTGIKKNITQPELFLNKINQMIMGTYSSGVLNGVNTLEAAEYIQNFVTEAMRMNDHSEENLHEMAFFGLVKDSLKLEENPDEIWLKLKDQVTGLLADYFTKQINKKQKVTVINYNFDDLLEFALERSGLKKGDCFIKNPGSTNILEGKSGVYIYHPHGTVSVIPNSLSEESQRLVLAESNYERLERKVYLWENSIQAKALHDMSCVFLGFSGEDYNFRRIIKNMERDEERQDINHYLFLSIESFVKTMFNEAVYKEILGNTARTEKERKEFLSQIKKQVYDDTLRNLLKSDVMAYEKMLIIKKLYAQYLYWARYGIIPIWTTRNELPEMVRKIIS